MERVPTLYVYRVHFFLILLLSLFVRTEIGSKLLAQEIRKQVEKADTSRTEPRDGEKAQPEVNEEAIKIFLDKVEVLGYLEKPQAIFIIPGTNPEVEDIDIDRSFFKEIFRPVEKRGRSPKKLTRRVAEPVLW